MKRRGLALAALSLAAGCAQQSFQPQFHARELPSEAQVLTDVSTPKPRDERPVAVGISADGARLFAWDLSAGLLWERAVRPKSAPLVAGDAIVMQEARGVTVRDLATGEVRAVVDEEGALVGADGEGDAIAITIAYLAKDSDARSAVAYLEGRSLRWKQELKMPVGVPALVNGRVLVPWATQRLSVLRAKDGAELVRWHLNNTVLGQARVDRGRVYVGQIGLMRLDAQLLQTKSPKVQAPFKRSLPGQPPLLRDGYVPVFEPENAHHRLQLEWRIGTDDAETSAENDLIALRFYRLLFALDAHGEAIRWVRTFDHDLVGAAIEPGGMFVGDAAGVLRFVGADGGTRMQRDMGRALLVLAIRPGGWVPDAASAVLESPLPSLREQLAAAAALDDARLGAGRAYAVDQLAAIPDESVTADLVQLCAERGSPQPVQSAACGHLGERTNGGDQVVQALRRRASFLEDNPAPPVGALAVAAGAMALKPAGQLLVSHLEDPNTPSADLPALIATLEKLDHKPAIASLERFARMHHAEPEGSELTPALYASLHALGALRARGSRGSLDDISQDPLAPQLVRDKAREAIAMLDAPKVEAPAKAEPQKPDPAEEAAPEQDEVETDPRPYSLGADIVREALKPVRARLSACLTTDPAKPRNARVSMVVNGTGSVEGVFVTPTTLQSCMETVLHEARFPQTRLGRQRITQTVYGLNAEEPAKPKKAKPAKPAKPAGAHAAGGTKPTAAAK
jgi:hypothetical protein